MGFTLQEKGEGMGALLDLKGNKMAFMLSFLWLSGPTYPSLDVRCWVSFPQASVSAALTFRWSTLIGLDLAPSSR